VEENQVDQRFGPDLYVSEEVTVVDSCEYANETSGSIICREFFHYLCSIEGNVISCLHICIQFQKL
jgi:hypothetical protein